MAATSYNLSSSWGSYHYFQSDKLNSRQRHIKFNQSTAHSIDKCTPGTRVVFVLWESMMKIKT